MIVSSVRLVPEWILPRMLRVMGLHQVIRMRMVSETMRGILEMRITFETDSG